MNENENNEGMFAQVARLQEEEAKATRGLRLTYVGIGVAIILAVIGAVVVNANGSTSASATTETSGSTSEPTEPTEEPTITPEEGCAIEVMGILGQLPDALDEGYDSIDSHSVEREYGYQSRVFVVWIQAQSTVQSRIAQYGDPDRQVADAEVGVRRECNDPSNGPIDPQAADEAADESTY